MTASVSIKESRLSASTSSNITIEHKLKLAMDELDQLRDTNARLVDELLNLKEDCTNLENEKQSLELKASLYQEYIMEE